VVEYALSDGEAVRGMWTGRVSAGWAAEQHAAWAEELTEAPRP
jgi:formate dehydrogenase subunit gamma